MPITINSAEDIEHMRVAGRLASEVLDYIVPYVQPGVTTAYIDKLCHDYMINVQGTVSACLNYAFPGLTPYPKAICTSVNHQVCHGIPGSQVLEDGDIINIDVTIIKNGYHGDTSRMFYVGESSAAARRLCEVTYECMCLGIGMVRPGGHLGDIGYIIQQHAHAQGYSIVRRYAGHGIGKIFHDEPSVYHYGQPGTRELMVPGMIFTIEPMLNIGHHEVEALPDKWTIVTKDRSLSAQWEHTVLVTETGFELLTVSAGSPAFPEFPPLPAFFSAKRAASALV